MKAIRIVLDWIRFLLKVISSLVGICLGLLVIGVIFLDELPLGEVPMSLQNPEKNDYLDMHVHIAGIGAGDSGCFVTNALRSSYKFRFYLKAMNVTHEEALEQGDALVVKRLSNKIRASSQVSRAVILALDGIVDKDGNLDREETQIYVPNEFVAQQAATYDNLLFGASINPYRSDALERLHNAIEQGAVLIKWIPSLMRIDPADKKLLPFYAALAQHNIPLLTHTGHEHSFLGVVNEYSDPLRLVLPLEMGVTVIAAHIATTGKNNGVSNFKRILPLFNKYPNLYSDISSLTQINKLGYLSKALKHDWLIKRLVNGSDWPLQFRLLVSPWYHFTKLSPAQMRHLSKIDNEFDRDILLKKSLGVPEEVFARSADLIGSKQ